MSSQKGAGPNQSNNNSHNSSKRKGNQSKKAGWRSSRLPTARKDDFKGECEDLKGKIYIVGSAKQADNFNNTTEAIMEYFLRDYTYGLDVVVSLENYKEKDFTPNMPVKNIPEGLSKETKESLELAFDGEMKQYIKRKGMLEANLIKAYGIIWGQCTKTLRAKIEARKDWNTGTEKEKIKYNAINLLKAIKEITHNFQDNKYAMESIYYAIKTVFTMKQEEHESITEFTKRFNNAMNIMETQHGEFSLSAYLKTRSDYQAAITSPAKSVIHKEQYD